ncbi:Cyclase-like protein 2, partial [Cucurbita argyrosperma subsp. sororia]
MDLRLPFLLFLFLQAVSGLLLAAASNVAYPSVVDTGVGDCSVSDGGDGSLTPIRREVYDNGRIIDISHRFTVICRLGNLTKGLASFCGFRRA